MVPFDPGELLAGRVPRRLHVEVAAGTYPLRPVLAFGVDDRDDVDVFIGVDVGEPAAVGRDRGAGGGPETWSDGRRLTPGERLPVDALVVLGNEVGNPVGQREVAAAVANKGANAEIGGEIARSIRALLNNENTAIRASLDPTECFAVRIPGWLTEAQVCGEGLRRDWARPEAVDGAFGHRIASVRELGPLP